MITILRGKTKEVIINTEGPVIIIGECINPTRRKKLVSTLQSGDFDYVLELAKNQMDALADILDVNVGFPGVDDVKLLRETAAVRAADLVLGRDDFAMRFIECSQNIKQPHFSYK